MIGCADGSAIAIALVYSAWTNRSYRQPILAATVLCCLGNLLVTLAYDFGGLPLLLVGRLVTGAGNARMISRRYMADFFSKDDRDRVSMLFVAASALGMAFGPFITWPLSLVLPRADEGSKVLGLSVNIITAGGWLMVAMWVAFYIFAHLMFDEPLDTDDARGGRTDEPPHAPDLQDCTPAQSTDNGATVSTAKLQGNGSEEAYGDSLGSSRLLNAPPFHRFAESEDVTMPLLADSVPQGSNASSQAAIKRMSEESVLLPATPSDPPCGHSPFAGTAVNVSGLQELGASESLASNSTVRLQPVNAPYVTDAEASASAVSFLGRALPAAPGESGMAAVWTRVHGAAGSVHFLPTVTCSMMLFLLKLLQQTTVSAVPVFTGDFYQWRERDVSLFMTALSLAMFFVTIAATLGNGLVRSSALPIVHCCVLLAVHSVWGARLEPTTSYTLYFRGPAAMERTACSDWMWSVATCFDVGFPSNLCVKYDISRGADAVCRPQHYPVCQHGLCIRVIFQGCSTSVAIIAQHS